MRVLETGIFGVNVVETSPAEDHRGSFARLFCERELACVLKGRRIVQINHSRTRAVGALRGLHFQRPPYAEMKLVRCVRGRVFDVAVDLRAGSPTILRWHSEELSPGNARLLVIPEGFAHGFQTLEPESELLYLVTSSYAPEAEAGVAYDDPSLAIAWPLTVSDLSARDRALPRIPIEFAGICV